MFLRYLEPKHNTNRSFRWVGTIPSLKTSNKYSVELKTFLGVPKSKMQQRLLEKDRLETIQLIRNTVFKEAYLNPLDRRDDRVWQILLKPPPTHSISISCHPKNGETYKIFYAAFNFHGFTYTSTQTAYLSSSFIRFNIAKFSTNWMLNGSEESSDFFLRCILARCRDLLKEDA